MKKYIILMLLVLVGSATFAQFGFLKGITQAQADARYPKLTDSVAGYDAAQIDSLLRLTSRRIIRNSTKLTHTGNTSKTLVFTDTIPANTFTANSTIHIQFLTSAVGTNGNKFLVFEFNNTEVSRSQMTSAHLSGTGYTTIYCKTTSSQVGPNTTDNSSSTLTATSNPVKTYTFDLSQDIIVKMYITLSNAADVASFESFQISVND